MKRLLCLVLCLMLAVPVVLAETADTLPKKYNRQLIGGNGVRGYVSITASGVAEWLDVLLPFTATDIQIRAIGEKQGDMSESVLDDDDWQVRFYAENSADEEVGTTWLYGDPTGVYFQSELLPDTLLTLPVEQVNLLYQLLHGEYQELLFAFDPFSLKAPGAQGNASAYQAVAELLGVPAETWEAEWLPVMEKYFLHLDLWLMGYGDPSFVTGDTGALTMSATYRIPVEELKAEAKYVIGQMLYDNDLQNLLLPYVTMEQRVTYLNPNMVYFYEACIDALPLEGDVVFSREMSASGEIVSANVSLPVPALPEVLTEPVGEAMALLFGASYANVLDGMNRIEIGQNGSERTISFSGVEYTVTIAADETNPDEYTTAYSGDLQILPADGQEILAAAFECSSSHRIWQDEKYLDHDTSTFTLALEPAFEEDDNQTYAEFAPIGIDWTVDYRNNPYQENSPVQINYTLDLQMPDAAVQAEAVLRIYTQLAMQTLPTAGALDVSSLPVEEKSKLVETFVENAVLIMTNLGGVPVETNAPVESAGAEPTAVPPMTE